MLAQLTQPALLVLVLVLGIVLTCVSSLIALKLVHIHKILLDLAVKLSQDRSKGQ